MRYRGPLALAALTMTTVLAGCGGSPTASGGSADNEGDKLAAAAQKVYDKFNGMSGQERTDALVKAAEAEGALAIYTSNNDIEELVDAFEDKYDIDVSAYRANSETVLQRLMQEENAHFYGADVLETNASEMNIVNQEGMLYPYESEYREAVRPEGLKENWTANRFNAFVVGWNTNLVKPGQEPQSYEDLADPRWKGKLAMEIADVDWYSALTTHWLEQGKTQEEVDELFKGIAANAKLTKGHTATTELLAAGQFHVFVSPYSSNIDDAAQNGAPVSWMPADDDPVQPIVVRANGVGLMKHAAHPAAAVLFTDFALTDGQAVLEEVKRIPSVPGGFDPLKGLELIEVPEQDLLENSDAWNKRYEEVTNSAQGTVETDG